MRAMVYHGSGTKACEEVPNPELMDPRRFSVKVKDGIVTLHGEPETTDLGHQLVRTVRHIQGVVAIRDRLIYPEPDMVAAPGCYVNHQR